VRADLDGREHRSGWRREEFRIVVLAFGPEDREALLSRRYAERRDVPRDAHAERLVACVEADPV
jgi:hypothetical protein